MPSLESTADFRHFAYAHLGLGPPSTDAGIDTDTDSDIDIDTDTSASGHTASGSTDFNSNTAADVDDGSDSKSHYATDGIDDMGKRHAAGDSGSERWGRGEHHSHHSQESSCEFVGNPADDDLSDFRATHKFHESPDQHEKSSSASSSSSAQPLRRACCGPNCPLRVTFVFRSTNRWIINMREVMHMLLATGLVGPEPYPANPYVRIVHLETLTFRQQVRFCERAYMYIIKWAY